MNMVLSNTAESLRATCYRFRRFWKKDETVQIPAEEEEDGGNGNTIIQQTRTTPEPDTADDLNSTVPGTPPTESPS